MNKNKIKLIPLPIGIFEETLNYYKNKTKFCDKIFEKNRKKRISKEELKTLKVVKRFQNDMLQQNKFGSFRHGGLKKEKW